VTILIDQDNVLADFDGGFLKEWRAQYPDEVFVSFEDRKEFYTYKDYPEELKDKIRAVYTAPGFIKNLTLIDGALEAVTQLIKLGHDVRICTSPLSNYENCVLEKYAWVEQHFGRDFIKRIVLTKDKTLIRGDILIDDKPVVTGLFYPEWRHIIFDRPWNKDVHGKRIIDWGNYKTVLEEVIGL